MSIYSTITKKHALRQHRNHVQTIINRCFNITGHFPFWYLSLIAFSKTEQNYMHKILGRSGLVLACNSKNVLTFEPFRMQQSPSLLADVVNEAASLPLPLKDKNTLSVCTDDTKFHNYAKNVVWPIELHDTRQNSCTYQVLLSNKIQISEKQEGF